MMRRFAKCAALECASASRKLSLRSTVIGAAGCLQHVVTLRVNHRPFFHVTAPLLQAASFSDEDIVRRTDWKSSSHLKRLGLTEADLIGKSEADVQLILKRHYRVLVKHYHPDNASAPKEGTEAFKAISEAYEILVKQGGNAGEQSGSSYTYTNNADFARRKGQIRFMGEGLGLFLIGSVVLIFITARHNRDRLGSTGLLHLVSIFLLLQLFPRLLAAAVLFAYHSSDMIRVAESELQARGCVVLEKTSPKSVKLRVEGYDDAAWATMRIQLQVVEEDASNSIPETTLLFDKGQREVTLPILPPPRKNRVSVKVLCDDGRKLVIVDNLLSV